LNERERLARVERAEKEACASVRTLKNRPLQTMKVTTIDQHLTQVIQLGAINCYLVREDDGFTLVDTCYSGAHTL
jgi:hypothetical protein